MGKMTLTTTPLGIATELVACDRAADILYDVVGEEPQKVMKLMGELAKAMVPILKKYEVK